MKIKTVGSICSGIEAASVAWEPLGFKFEWFSEISDFPSAILQDKYPMVQNVGDMVSIPELMRNKQLQTPDLLCGGTPCQAFSLAGWKNGLEDERGNLTLKLVEIAETNDDIRIEKGLKPSIVFWENVEGVLKDKTNAFGSLVSSLAGLDEAIEKKKWPNAGLIRGPKRNVAWRVLDAKFFGVPQQRKRVYLLAGGKDFNPEEILFEINKGPLAEFQKSELDFSKEGVNFKIFREYTDCLYSAYGTKWNGNAAAYNGSLFVVQNERIRRLTPLECERLMGFPDNYTKMQNSKNTPRYQAIGNSWAVPVITWIGKKINDTYENIKISERVFVDSTIYTKLSDDVEIWGFTKGLVETGDGTIINCTPTPEEVKFSSMKDVLTTDAPKELYISPVGCFGIVRRKKERELRINPQLEQVLINISTEMTKEEIEKKSRIQKRGRFSDNIDNSGNLDIQESMEHQLSLF
jgi:DNA (cytosine-5)-methyltransferase 1